VSRNIHYTVAGNARDNQTWEVSGTILIPPGGFRDAVDQVMRATFISLTHGKAIYGKPGLHCMGPYHFTKLVMEEKET